MHRIILSVASAPALTLKARLKGLFWLVLPVITIGVLRLLGRNNPSPPQIPSDSYSQSDLPYRTPPQNIYDNRRTSVPSKYSTANQAPSPDSHHRQLSTSYPTQLPRPAAAFALEVTYPPTRSYEDDEYRDDESFLEDDESFVLEHRCYQYHMAKLSHESGEAVDLDEYRDDESFLEDDESFVLEHRCYQYHMAKLSYESGEAVDRDEEILVKDLALNTTPLGTRPTLPSQHESQRPAGRQPGRSRKVPRLDLHGYRVKEAISHSKRAIEDAQRRGHSQIRLIVGKGLHSENNIARIKPALGDWLRRHNLTSNVDPQNAGVLIVQLA